MSYTRERAARYARADALMDLEDALSAAARQARQTQVPALAEMRVMGCSVVLVPPRTERAQPLAESIAGLLAGGEAEHEL